MNIADLSNLGSKSQQMLAHAGIHTLEQLRGLGAVRAYVQVKRSGACSSVFGRRGRAHRSTQSTPQSYRLHADGDDGAPIH